jgi:hypothetical protein
VTPVPSAAPKQRPPIPPRGISTHALQHPPSFGPTAVPVPIPKGAERNLRSTRTHSISTDTVPNIPSGFGTGASAEDNITSIRSRASVFTSPPPLIPAFNFGSSASTSSASSSSSSTSSTSVPLTWTASSPRISRVKDGEESKEEVKGEEASTTNNKEVEEKKDSEEETAKTQEEEEDNESPEKKEEERLRKEKEEADLKEQRQAEAEKLRLEKEKEEESKKREKEQEELRQKEAEEAKEKEKEKENQILGADIDFPVETEMASLLREVVLKLPRAHYDTLRYLTGHLRRMLSYRKVTNMSISNLAIGKCLPFLLPPLRLPPRSSFFLLRLRFRNFNFSFIYLPTLSKSSHLQ